MTQLSVNTLDTNILEYSLGAFIIWHWIVYTESLSININVMRTSSTVQINVMWVGSAERP